MSSTSAKPALALPTVTVGYAFLHFSVPIEQLVDFLTPEQRERAASMNTRRKAQYCFGRWGLHALAQRCGNVIETIENPPDSPTLKIDGNLYFSSISHCQLSQGYLTAVAFHTEHIGVDIEGIRSGWTGEKVEMFCTPEEIQAANTIPDRLRRNEYYTQCWSRKEALAKCHTKSVWDKAIVSQNLLNHPTSYDRFFSQLNAVSSVHTLNRVVVDWVALPNPIPNLRFD